MFQIVHDTFEALMFAKSIMKIDAVENMNGIGLTKDGEFIAACLFEGYNGQNVWMHVAAVPTKRWMTRQYLSECFGFAFDTLRVERVSGYVNASNVAAVKLDEHLGFKREATLKGAAYDGGDVYSYVMWREDCRFLGDLYGR